MFGSGKRSLSLSIPRKERALAASGERVTPRDSDGLRRLIQPWQRRAYRYYDDIPEVKFGAQFYSRMLSPLRLFAAEIDEKGEIVETEDKDAIAQVERIQDPGGGRSGLLGAYGRLMFLGGEAYLTVTLDTDADQEQWEMLSPHELRLNADGNYTRLKAPSLMPENYRDPPDNDFEPMTKDEAVVYRLWRRHPVYSYYADSTMQGVLDVCEELLWLTKAVKNRARSRLASAGILIINGQITTVPIGGDTADENAEEDPFIRDLVEAMTAPIADNDSASAVVPMVVRAEGGNFEDINNIMKHLQIVDPMQLYPEQGLRREAIERLAIGLDMPPEVLLGIAGVNHWSGWLVDEQSWKGHGQPIAQQFCDDITAAFLRPTLRAEGKDDWQRFLIGYDPAAVINHPDRSKDAKDLHEKGALSDEALREANGFDDDDKPSEEERQIWLGIQLRDANVALNGEVSPTPAPFGAAPTDPEEEVDGAGKPDVKRTPPEEPAATEEGPEDIAASANGNGNAWKLLAASDVALHRAREIAGSRLRNYAKRDKEAEKLLDGVKAGQVAPTLGAERAKAIGAPPERDLVAGARDLIAETLRLWQIDESLAEPLGERIEQHAARTLFDERPAPLPPRFENYVRGLEAVAG